MDFWTSIQVIGRRWRIFVPALLISLIVTFAVVHEVKPTYQASSTVLIVPPKISTTTNPLASQNAYLQFPNYNTVAAILANSETTPSAKSELAAKGVTASYTASPDPAGQVPEVNLTVTGKDPSVYQQSQTLTQDVSARLLALQSQAGAPQVSFLTTSVLSPPALKTVNSSRIKIAGALGAILLFLSIALAFAAESLAKRREALAGSGSDLPAPIEGVRPSGRVSFRLRMARPQGLNRAEAGHSNSGEAPELVPPRARSALDEEHSNGQHSQRRDIVHPLERPSEALEPAEGSVPEAQRFAAPNGSTQHAPTEAAAE